MLLGVWFVLRVVVEGPHRVYGGAVAIHVGVPRVLRDDLDDATVWGEIQVLLVSKDPSFIQSQESSHPPCPCNRFHTLVVYSPLV